MGRSIVGVSSERGARIVRSAAVLLAVGVLAAGCTMGDDDEDLDPVAEPPASAGPSAVPSAEPTPSGPPTLVKKGTAEDNLPYFDLVNLALEAKTGDDKMPSGRKIIDNLVDSGFPKKRMEITPDRTAIDLAADTIEFTVLIDDQCLFGQFGDFAYRSVVLPVLDTGKCLVGTTRKIDW